MTTSNTPQQLLLKVPEAAQLLSISTREVKDLIYSGQLERRYIGSGTKYYRIPYSALLAYADSLPEAKVEKD